MIGSITSRGRENPKATKSERPTTPFLKPYLSQFGSSHHRRARNNRYTREPEHQRRSQNDIWQYLSSSKIPTQDFERQLEGK